MTISLTLKGKEVGSSGSEDAEAAVPLAVLEKREKCHDPASNIMWVNGNDAIQQKTTHLTSEMEPAKMHIFFKCLNVKTVDVIIKFLAELSGTAMLLLFGCSSVLPWGNTYPPSWQSGLVFGLVVMIIIQCFGNVSGAHFNPVVSLCALLHGGLSFSMFCLYTVAQVLGAFTGFGILALLTPSHIFRPEHAVTGNCSTVPTEGLTILQVLAFEFLSTTVIIAMCCSAWNPVNAHKHDAIALKFGFAVAALSISVGPATACSMNPARTLGPAIWNGDWTMHWVYWVGPSLASVVTTFVYRCLFAEHPPSPKRHETGA